MFAIPRIPLLLVCRLAPVFVFAFGCGFVEADKPDRRRAFELVQQGVNDFQAADFEAAAANFEKAIELTEDTSVIRFDQACVDLANGETDSAREKLRDAVSGSDPEVVQSAHYNLGFLKVQQAKASIPSDPTTIPKKSRKDVVDQLEQAARSFRNTLEINRDHADAAYNLELVRMYLKHLKTIWKQQDEQKQEPEESLTQLILRLQSSFRDARQKTGHLRDEPASASRQAAVAEFQQDIQALHADVGKVRPLVEQWLQSAISAGQPQSPGQPVPQPTPEEVAAQEALTSIVDQLESVSQETLSSSNQEDWSTVGTSSNRAVLHLHQLFLNVASYQEALQAALQQQTKLNSTMNASAATSKSMDEQTASWGQAQQLISDLAHAIQLQAEQQKSQVDAQLEQMANARTASPATPPPGASQPKNSPTATTGAPSVLQADEQRKMLEGLSESMGRAISLGPDAVSYADKAAVLILQIKGSDGEARDEVVKDADAVSRESAQQKVRLILEDIAEPLMDPESDEQQSSDQNQQDDQEQSGDEQSSQDENSDPNDSDGEESESPEQQQPEEAGDNRDGASDSEDEEKGEGADRPAQNMQQQQAEAVLRRAAEREQEYRELLKNLQRQLRRKQTTKDW